MSRKASTTSPASQHHQPEWSQISNHGSTKAIFAPRTTCLCVLISLWSGPSETCKQAQAPRSAWQQVWQLAVTPAIETGSTAFLPPNGHRLMMSSPWLASREYQRERRHKPKLLGACLPQTDRHMHTTGTSMATHKRICAPPVGLSNQNLAELPEARE
jgi:hypothetical protein